MYLTISFVSLACLLLAAILSQRKAVAQEPNPAAPEVANDAVDLDTLTWASATNGIGDVHVGTNIAGGTCKLNGDAFANCLGLHADAELVYNVSGFSRFTAIVGLDDNVNDPAICTVNGHYYQTATVGFQIYGDESLLYDSGPLNKDDRVRAVDINLPANTNSLRIVANDVDGKITCDHADIGGGRLYASPNGTGGSTPQPTRVPTRTALAPTRTPTRKPTSAPTIVPTKQPTSVATPAGTAGPKIKALFWMHFPMVSAT